MVLGLKTKVQKPQRRKYGVALSSHYTNAEWVRVILACGSVALSSHYTNTEWVSVILACGLCDSLTQKSQKCFAVCVTKGRK